VTDFGYKSELRRSLGFADLLIYGLVFIAPAAPFSIFGIVYNSSHGMVPLTYVVGLVAMVFTALSYREMSVAFPIAGSVYSYAGRGLHPWAGFLAGWGVLLDYLLLPTLAYLAAAAAMHAIVPGVPESAWVIGFLGLNTSVNLLGIETTARANRVMLAVQLAVLGAFFVLAVLAVHRGVNAAHWSTAPLFDPAAFDVTFVFRALSVAVLAFLGFDAISTLAEEAKGGGQAVGRATLWSLVVAAVLFVAQTYLAALLVPAHTVFEGDAAMNDAFYTIAALVGGQTFKLATALMVAMAAGIANALVAQAATARLLFAMARDGQLPRAFAHVHPTRQVPDRALLFVSAVSLMLGLFFVGQLALLSSLVNFGALFSFLMLHAAVVVHFFIRRRTGRVGLHLVSPVLGFAIIAFVLFNADVHAKIGGLVWLGIGVVILVGVGLAGRSVALRLE
jgi:amino acid transporter